MTKKKTGEYVVRVESATLGVMAICKLDDSIKACRSWARRAFPGALVTVIRNTARLETLSRGGRVANCPGCECHPCCCPGRGVFSDRRDWCVNCGAPSPVKLHSMCDACEGALDVLRSAGLLVDGGTGRVWRVGR